MSALGCVRLLPLLRCQHATLRASHIHNRSSGLLQAFASQSPSAKALQTWRRQTVPGVAQRRIESQPKFSTSSTNSDSFNKSSSKPKVESQSKEPEEAKQCDFDLSDPNKSLFKKFNENLKKYWYVMLPVHMVTSSAYFVGFCYIASQGFSPIPLLEEMGLFDEWLKQIKDSDFGTIAVALVFQKLASPIRYFTTWYTVKALAGRGKLLTSTEFLALMKKKYISRKKLD